MRWLAEIGRILMRVVMVIILIIIILPILLYIPAIQNFAKDIALEEVRKSSGYDIAVDRLRLRFPLRIELDGVSVVEPEVADTMVKAALVAVDVAPLPLLKLDVKASKLHAHDVTYRLGTPDSVIYLTASLNHLNLDRGDISLKGGDIDVGDARVDGVKVRLVIKPDSTITPVDTTKQSKPLKIKARSIEMKDVEYTMQMYPTIDSLYARIPSATLSDGVIDMSENLIHARYLGVENVDATYLFPSPEFLKAHPELTITKPEQPSASAPWTVKGDSLHLSATYALYGMKGATQVPGLDMNHIEATDIDIAVKDFYNRGTDIRVPITRLKGTERCGLRLGASGLFTIADEVMGVSDFRVEANNSLLSIAKGVMGIGDLTTDPNIPLALDAYARIYPADILRAFPSARPMLSPLEGCGSAVLTADIEGTSGSLEVHNLSINGFNKLKLKAKGHVDKVMDFENIGGKLTLDGSLTDGSLLARVLPAGTLPEGLHVPSMQLAGTVDYHPGHVDGNLKATAGGGRVAAAGKWIARSESYDATLSLADFPVDAFMPSLGIGKVTASLKAKGHGYNPLALSTEMDMDANVASLFYKQQEIKNISLSALTGGGSATGKLTASDPNADLDIDFNATMHPDEYVWDLSGDIRHLDLQSLKLTVDPAHGSMEVSSAGRYDPRDGSIDGKLSLNQIEWDIAGLTISQSHMTALLTTTPSSVNANLENGDLSLRLVSESSLDSLIRSTEGLSAVIDSMMVTKRFDVAKLQRSLPPMEVMFKMGSDNLPATLLAEKGTLLRSAYLDIRNDSLLTLSGLARGFRQGNTVVDSIDIGAYQRGNVLVFNASANNAPGSMDNFAHIRLNGFISENRLSTFLTQSNIKGEEGFNFGLLFTTADSVITARIVPTTPTLAYRKFTLNADNFLSFNFVTDRIHGNISLSDGNTALQVYTEGGDDPATPEDLIVDIRNLQLADYLTISPFAPPLKGLASANLRVRYDNKILTGKGTLGLDDFYYDKQRVGSFNADMKVYTDPASRLLRAKMDMTVDSLKVLTVRGVLNDTTAKKPVGLSVDISHLPLKIANPFLPADMARLEGALNGRLRMTGEMTKPEINGYLNFDTTAVNVKMLGTKFKFSDELIRVKNGVVYFDDFTIEGVNENPLYVNGNADISNLADPKFDFNLYAHDLQVVNSTRPRGASVYGKGWLDINANVKGNMRFMRAQATVDLLSGSNISYVLSPATTGAMSMQGQEDMVHFVQFNDTTAMNSEDMLNTKSTFLLLEANLIVSEGTTINVDLSTTNNDKVSIQGNGNLSYTQSPLNSGRLTGRFNINEGFVRYTPPAIISEKYFTFYEGSYVEFNGAMDNPILNIHAYDRMKANVTRSGENSRLVDFDVKVNVTGSLENMNVGFDLSTDDDIAVSNEIASMSPEQRANQAMNLLLYGVYNSSGTSANANLGGNLLYTFVESTVNNWMANNVKFVDISFGIDQYDKTYNGSTSTATNYSYHVSKTLFNDRFKIVIGGSYSTDNEGNDENVAESLINDISAEYLLNRAGTMYVRIFRHTGYESILEGEVTQTGVGFVYRRRIGNIGEFFRRVVGRGSDNKANIQAK